MRLIAHQPDGFDPSLPWLDLETRVVGETRLFRQIMTRRRSPHTDREHDFTRLACPEWINVLAFTREGEVLVVEQFRHGVDAGTLEIVGGVVEPGEEPSLAARRELLEETGFEPGLWIPLGSCAPNPAVQDNRCHFYLALDCVPVGIQHLDPSEEIRLWGVPWGEMKGLLEGGRVDHALVMAAFLRLFLWEGWADLEARLLG
jgi:8-oxo-dGTP pyrophosphatase MutT (NUDIX family)